METHWDNIHGREVTYHDQRWELTGDVDVINSGDVIALEARQRDDVKGERARIYCTVESGSKSINPGAMGDHFDSVLPDGPEQVVRIKTHGRTYRYELARLEYV